MPTERFAPQPRTFYPDFPLYLAHFRQRVSEILPRLPSKQVFKPATFELIDILFEFLMERESRMEDKNFHTYIVKTLQTQLEAVLKEQFKLPFHEDYSVVDLERFMTQNILHIAHPGYRDIDQGDYFKKAAQVAGTEAQRTRYQRESDQFQELRSRLLADLTSETNPAIFPDGEVNIAQWKAVSAQEAVPAHVAQAVGLKGGETVYIHRKHALALPINTDLYPDGKGYLNVYGLVYLPDQKQVILVTDHLYRAIPLDEHYKMLQKISDSPLPDLDPKLPNAAKEKILLELVVTLPETLRTSSTVSLFLDLINDLPTSQKESGRVEIEQQRIMQKFMGSRSNLNRAVAFLTQVLIAEHRMCSAYPNSTSTLLERLHIAMEMVFNPLFSGDEMNVRASKKVYMDMLFKKQLPAPLRAKLATKPARSWLKHVPEPTQEKRLPKLHTLQQTVTRLQKESRTLDLQEFHKSPLRNEAIRKLSIDAPGILKRVVGEAMCHASGAGEIFKDSSSSSSSSSSKSGSLDGGNWQRAFSEFDSLVSRGPLRDRGFLESTIGTQRADLWKMGSCVCGSECYFPNQEQLVGECGVCYFCERMPRSKFDDLKSQQNLKDWVEKDLDTAQEAVDTGKPFWRLPAGDFLPYMLSTQAEPVALR